MASNVFKFRFIDMTISIASALHIQHTHFLLTVAQESTGLDVLASAMDELQETLCAVRDVQLAVQATPANQIASARSSLP